MTWWILPFTLPSLVLGYFLGLLSLALGISKSPRFERGVYQTTWRPKFAARWRYSTTLGFWMGIHPNHGRRVVEHEFVHIRQYEDLNVLGAVIGGIVAIFNWKLGLILWCSSGPLWLLGNFLTGWLRWGDAYYGAEHERSAYAQTRDQ